MQTTHQAGLADDPHAALAAIGARLEEIVVDAGPASWTTQTPAEGWDVRTQIAHLTWTDEVSLAAITDPDAFAVVVDKAVADPSGFVDAGAEEVAQAERVELLDRWRTARGAVGEALASADPGEPIPWFGPPMRPKSMVTARIMETWAHGTDIADALGVTVENDPAFLGAEPHVARIGFRTRGFAYSVHGLTAPTSDVHVTLTDSQGLTHEFGAADDAQSVTGSLRDFCLLVTQRVNRADTDLVAAGDDANTWLDLAQAFAGLPGAGREAGEKS